MPLISEQYRAQNAELHARNESYGISGQMWAPYVAKLIQHEHHESILDYGCGKGTLFATLKANNIPEEIALVEYDPCIEGKNAEPVPCDLVVCTDVLEHIEPVHLNAVLRHIASVTKRKLFLNVSTNPSSKKLEDGRNAHLIVKDGEWWREKIGAFFRIAFWQYNPEVGFCYGEVVPKHIAPKKQFRRCRRPITSEIQQMIAGIREQNHRYADVFTRLNTFSVWEGVDDEPADMQLVMDVLEHVDDVDMEMRNILKYAQKGILAMVPLSKDQNEVYWKRLFERYLRVGDWHVDKIPGPDGKMHDRLIMCGAPMVGVQGVTAVGAVDTDDRWDQLLAAMKRVQGRIALNAPHSRTAILACYGPSLADTIHILKEEAAKPNVDVISVSGAHDFLLQHGIVPRYHIECDPRPHKADNIDAGHPDVEYLIGSSVHPVLLDKLEGCNVKLWHVSTPEHASRLIEELGEPGPTVISGGGSVGLRSIPVLYTLGYREIFIFAMDCSFKSDGETVQQWAGKHAGKKQDACEVMCGDRLFISSPVLLTYATGFFETIQRVSDLTYRMYGDGLLQSMCRLYAGMPQVAGITLHDLPATETQAA